MRPFKLFGEVARVVALGKNGYVPSHQLRYLDMLAFGYVVLVTGVVALTCLATDMSVAVKAGISLLAVAIPATELLVCRLAYRR